MAVSTEKRIDDAVRAALGRAGVTRGSMIVIAVSGGPDSLALLHALERAARDGSILLHGAHLDHRLRGEASRSDARFVAEVFRGLGIEGTVEEADVASYRKKHRLSVEDAARRVRYDFLGRVAAERKAVAIALGHTADDQAETVLMHVLRGSGLTGLAGMQESASRRLSGRDVLLLRPLIGVSRHETEKYCQSLGLEPRHDETNLIPELMRNRLRSELLPLLEQYNPAVKEALVRLSRSASRDMDYLVTEVSRVLPDVGGLDKETGLFTIDRKAFSRLHPSLQGHLLRRAFQQVKGDLGDLEQVHVDEMMRLIAGPAGRSADLPSDLIFTVGYESATIGREGADTCPLPPLDGEHELALPGETRVGGWVVSTAVVDDPEPGGREAETSGVQPAHTATLNAGSLGGRISVRSRRPGDRFQPLGMPNAKKLQDFMVDSKVPRSWRDRVPLVVAASGIAWVVGWRPAEWAKIRNDGEPAVQITFRHDG